MKKIFLICTIFFGFVFGVQAEENSVVDMADKNGIKTCRAQLKQVSDFIIDDNSHGTHAYWNSKDSDNRMYATLTSKGYADGDSHVTIVTSQTSSGDCDSLYVETFAFQKSCMITREEIYKTWAYKGTMNGKTILLENSGGTVDVYLSPQGENICLVSRREMISP